MSSAACARCDAVGQSGNFCTSCGYDLRPPEPAVLTPRHREPEPLAPPAVVTCGSCGALNAKSRRVCARCRAPLAAGSAAVPPATASSTGAPATGAGPAAPGFGPPLRATPPPARSPVLLRVVLGLAAVAILAVTGTLLAARRGAPPADPSPSASLAELPVRAVRASSAADAEPARRAVDGDPGTAWAEDAAGPGVGEWLELRLDQRARISRLNVWNGDQRGARFVARNRVHELRIDVGESRFTVELLDTQGPQVVELPRPVEADRLRLTVLSVHGATPDAATALSELVLYGTAAG